MKVEEVRKRHKSKPIILVKKISSYKYRIRNTQGFKILYSHGRKIVHREFIAFIMRCSELMKYGELSIKEPIRSRNKLLIYGTVASKKIGNSCIRNFCKRRMRSLCDHLHDELTINGDESNLYLHDIQLEKCQNIAQLELNAGSNAPNGIVIVVVARSNMITTKYHDIIQKMRLDMQKEWGKLDLN